MVGDRTVLNRGPGRLKAQARETLNPVGMKLYFQRDGLSARARFTLGENHQGEPGLAHTGILALLLDEAMGWIARHGACVNSVTAEMEIEYRRQAKIGEPLVVVCRIVKDNRRLLKIAARIEDADGAVIAEGNCLQYVVSANADPAPDYPDDPGPAVK